MDMRGNGTIWALLNGLFAYENWLNGRETGLTGKALVLLYQADMAEAATGTQTPAT